MQIRVESHTDPSGDRAPRRFYLDERDVDVVENLDQWHGPDYRYFKLRGADGNLYILRLDETRCEWELTMFQSPRGEAVMAHSVPVKPQRYAM